MATAMEIFALPSSQITRDMRRVAKTVVFGIVYGISPFGLASNIGVSQADAKKYIETGQHGGKASPAHRASVIGDTVGDPFKDTSGPSLNILVNCDICWNR